MNDETLEKEKSRRVVTGALLLLLLAALAAAYAAGNSAAGGQLIAGAADIAALRGLDAGTISPAAIFLIFAAATLISEDLACISAGVLAAQGRIGLALAISSCAVGILAGDLLLFAAGRFFGRPALQSRFVRHFISENAFEKSSRWLEREGLKTVFISRFVFGLRLPLYFAAGVLKTSFWRFALYFSLAVTIWTPLVVGLAYLLGAEIAGEALSARYFWLGLPALAAGLYLALRLAMRLATWKGRRLLWGKIKRRLIWEFWSIRVFYLPVVVYIVYLGVRFRDLTVFTCANPAIMAGGFAGESKDRIFSGLQASEAARPHLLAHLLITSKLTAEARLAAAEDFITARDLAFPIVLKPDVGERGAGVRIVASKEDLAARLRAAKEDLILQQHAPGEEVSVFYVRRPAAEKGEIFAITEKLFPHVAGDGRATLEELILRDRRAVCLAESYLERNAARLETVPAAGERVTIVDIGTHSRGAVFLDGGRLKTGALEETIDRICRGYEGFYFGRFDIRTESLDDFKRGRNFRIVELNGVTSEATNIYDPQYSLFDAYRILFKQWRIAFEIGRENKKRGALPTSARDLIKLGLGRGRVESDELRVESGDR
jgi:membrane protein DedA with SNARE-associated domain